MADSMALQRAGVILAAVAIVSGFLFEGVLTKEFREWLGLEKSAVEPDTKSAAEPERKLAAEPERKSAAEPQNLAGTWRMTNTIESTKYQPFQGLQLGFHLTIEQNGTTFNAVGQKQWENGKAIPENRRTAISVEGTIEGARVRATFKEPGGNRGTLDWTLDPSSGTLHGRFDSNASRGPSNLIRVP
jgi:hypothetical protein